MKRKTLDQIQRLIDNARINCNMSNSLVLIVLDECKRPPYLTPDEIDTVARYVEDAKVQLDEALELLEADKQ